MLGYQSDDMPWQYNFTLDFTAGAGWRSYMGSVDEINRHIGGSFCLFLCLMALVSQTHRVRSIWPPMFLSLE